MRPVTVLVDGPVSAVAFDLDGQEVGRRTAAPWTTDINFGREFAPHELVARALDARGNELARARQWINLPRPPAEVEVLLEKNAIGKAVAARLSWASRFGAVSRVTVLFDGHEIVVPDIHRVELPDYDASIGHVLTVRLEFPYGVRSRADRVLGGGSSDEAGSELTAVPIRSPAKGGPSLESLEGRLVKRGSPLKATGVERGPATVVVVRGLDEENEASARLGSLRSLRLDGTEVDLGDQIQVQWPVSREIPDVEGSNILFEASRPFQGMGVSFAYVLLQIGYPEQSLKPRQYADAVAVAAIQAAASSSRRAVVLVLGKGDRDESTLDRASIRRYLGLLRVPFYVWSLSGTGPGVPAGGVGHVRGYLDSRCVSARGRSRSQGPRQPVDRLGRGPAPASGHHGLGGGRGDRARALRVRRARSSNENEDVIPRTKRRAIPS